MIRTKIYSLLTTLTGFLGSLAFAIAVPILFRPFYYLQIGLLGIMESSGYSYDTIRHAYDSVLDYLLFGGEFSTGSLAWSTSGRAHFEDCQKLFYLDFMILGISILLLLILLILESRKKIRMHRFCQLHPLFYSGILNITLLITITVWGLTSFDSFFRVFHMLLFPGKDNWILDSGTDEIIKIMPEQFFFNCAALIVAILLIFSMFFLILSVRKRKQQRKGSYE
ncbi:TIGR01906 family membrane protein [Ruminococcus sp. OA3]|uniref:TIGR01906 family membrane protein n=1 Tax=Ruminococcus sp. OA3 TaxID=2914164 RepID=UPI001F065160|nr:TIGR01906 family membrane protein [Ruminococcus sp. OA3]MCH1983747.1 TIGR01906 family membrane protein [Ruminococcus sp. OA3]